MAPLSWVAWPDISTGSPVLKPETLTSMLIVLSPFSTTLGTWLFDIKQSSLGCVCVAGEIALRFPGARQVALYLIEVKRLVYGHPRLGKMAGRAQDIGQVKQGVGVLAQQVSLRGERHRRGRELGRLGVTAVVGEHPGRQSLADDLGDQ